jgi:hypothetical protein
MLKRTLALGVLGAVLVWTTGCTCCHKQPPRPASYCPPPCGPTCPPATVPAPPPGAVISPPPSGYPAAGYPATFGR